MGTGLVLDMSLIRQEKVEKVAIEIKQNTSHIMFTCPDGKSLTTLHESKVFCDKFSDLNANS